MSLWVRCSSTTVLMFSETMFPMVRSLWMLRGLGFPCCRPWVPDQHWYNNWLTKCYRESERERGTGFHFIYLFEVWWQEYYFHPKWYHDSMILCFGLREMLLRDLKYFMDCYKKVSFMEQCPLGQMPFPFNNVSYIMWEQICIFLGSSGIVEGS